MKTKIKYFAFRAQGLAQTIIDTIKVSQKILSRLAISGQTTKTTRIITRYVIKPLTISEPGITFKNTTWKIGVERR